MGSELSIENVTAAPIYVHVGAAWDVLLFTVGALLTAVSLGAGAAAGAGLWGAGAGALNAVGASTLVATQSGTLFTGGWVAVGAITAGALFTAKTAVIATTISGVLGLTSTTIGFITSNTEGVTLDDLDDMRAQLNDALEGYTVLLPGEKESWGGTLSLVLQSTIFDDGANQFQRKVWTHPLAGGVREYTTDDGWGVLNDHLPIRDWCIHESTQFRGDVIETLTEVTSAAECRLICQYLEDHNQIDTDEKCHFWTYDYDNNSCELYKNLAFKHNSSRKKFSGPARCQESRALDPEELKTKVTLYEHGNFDGNWWGIAKLGQLTTVSFANDVTSSIRVHDGYKVTVCEHGCHGNGQKQVLFPGSYQHHEIGIPNDSLSEVIVERTNGATTRRLDAELRAAIRGLDASAVDSVDEPRRRTSLDQVVEFEDELENSNTAGSILESQGHRLLSWIVAYNEQANTAWASFGANHNGEDYERVCDSLKHTRAMCRSCGDCVTCLVSEEGCPASCVNCQMCGEASPCMLVDYGCASYDDAAEMLTCEGNGADSCRDALTRMEDAFTCLAQGVSTDSHTVE